MRAGEWGSGGGGKSREPGRRRGGQERCPSMPPGRGGPGAGLAGEGGGGRPASSSRAGGGACPRRLRPWPPRLLGSRVREEQADQRVRLPPPSPRPHWAGGDGLSGSFSSQRGAQRLGEEEELRGWAETLAGSAHCTPANRRPEPE